MANMEPWKTFTPIHNVHRRQHQRSDEFPDYRKPRRDDGAQRRCEYIDSDTSRSVSFVKLTKFLFLIIWVVRWCDYREGKEVRRWRWLKLDVVILVHTISYFFLFILKYFYYLGLGVSMRFEQVKGNNGTKTQGRRKEIVFFYVISECFSRLIFWGQLRVWPSKGSKRRTDRQRGTEIYLVFTHIL